MLSGPALFVHGCPSECRRLACSSSLHARASVPSHLCSRRVTHVGSRRVAHVSSRGVFSGGGSSLWSRTHVWMVILHRHCKRSEGFPSTLNGVARALISSVACIVFVESVVI